MKEINEQDNGGRTEDVQDQKSDLCASFNSTAGLDLCRRYVQQITQASAEVGIFEFSISAVWKDGQFDIEKRYTTDTNTVWDYLRFDALLINCRKQYVRGFEFKVNRSDFLQDKKWEKYLKYCNTFSFVCPPGVIKKGELPKGIGLVYVVPDRSRWVKIDRIQNSKSQPIEKDIYVDLIRNMLMKAKFREGQLI